MGPCFKSYFYLINLTGQKQYMTELKWIWPVVVSTLSSTNQKQFPDLGSDASSVWNFCACFAEFRRETSGNIAKCQQFSQQQQQQQSLFVLTLAQK